MKIQLTTTAGVTTATVKTDLTRKMMDVVTRFKPEATKITDDNKKLVFAVAAGKKGEANWDGKLLVLEGKTPTSKLVFREILVDGTKERVNGLKIDLVKIKEKLEKVEVQVKDAYKDYESAVNSITEVVTDEDEEEASEEESEEEGE